MNREWNLVASGNKRKSTQGVCFVNHCSRSKIFSAVIIRTFSFCSLQMWLAKSWVPRRRLPKSNILWIGDASMPDHIIQKARWNLELISEWFTLESFLWFFVLFATEKPSQSNSDWTPDNDEERSNKIKPESIAVIKMQFGSSEKRKCLQFYAQRSSTLDCANSWCVFDQLTIMRFRLVLNCFRNCWWLRKKSSSLSAHASE